MAVSLVGSNPPGAPVGVPVVWTASAEGHGPAPVYQFRVGPAGGPTRVARDFSPGNTFRWDPVEEGGYDVQVIVKGGFEATGGETATALYVANPRVLGIDAAVSPTSHPLVALYSVPASAGGPVRVEFRPQGTGEPWTSTAPRGMIPGKTTNIFVAGMRAGTAYEMRHVLGDGATSAPLVFTTGGLPASGLKFPGFRVQRAKPQSLLSQEVVFHVGVGGPNDSVNAVATDLQGNIVWYFDPMANNFAAFAPSVVPGGTVLLMGDKRDNEAGVGAIREVNLAGDLLRETSFEAVNPQLAARGLPTIVNFHHDVQRLPNGHTAVLGRTSRTLRIKGKPTEYVTDMIIVLDQDFQVAWAWDPFAHLNPRRLPRLGEGAKDWTHANSVAWSPTDGNLIMSMRSLDWVIKVNYANGAGDGRVIWKLGQGGDFKIKSRNPSPWFSHQHDARYINDNTIVLFDNGNGRYRRNPSARSRGQELVLDETRKIARLVVNADLGDYAPFTGSAQKLRSGRFNLDSPLLGKTIVVKPNGKRLYVLKMKLPGVLYRTYIYSNLYSSGEGSNLPTTAVRPRPARRG